MRAHIALLSMVAAMGVSCGNGYHPPVPQPSPSPSPPLGPDPNPSPSPFPTVPDPSCVGDVDRPVCMQMPSCSANAVAVSTGENHTCALTDDAAAWCWGELGPRYSGVTTAVPAPVMALGTQVAQVVAGAFHTCARKLDGTLWCFGEGVSGELGTGQTYGQAAPVRVPISDVVFVSAGYERTCAVRSDGTLWCWGEAAHGAVGDETQGDANSLRTQPVQVFALGTQVLDVSVGGAHVCARKQDRSLWCFGQNAYGQIGDGSFQDALVPVQVMAVGTHVIAYSAGHIHTCASLDTGETLCWGNNSPNGQLGDGTTSDRFVPTPARINNQAGVSAGGAHTCARSAAGVLSCWGSDASEQLGDSGTRAELMPQLVSASDFGALDVTGVSAGFSYTCALVQTSAQAQNRSLYCWGANDWSQLGDGTTVMRGTPTLITLSCN
jgi:alpha-tubulin suppressor-like RCC1 family protein